MKELNAAREFQYYADYGMCRCRHSHRNFGGRRIIGLAGKLGTVEAGKWPTSSPSPGDPLKDITELQHVKL